MSPVFDWLDFIIIFNALICIIMGLLLNFHKNNAIFILSIFFIVSNVINPVLFMSNKEIYTYTGWGAVRSFDFTVESIIKNYSSSNLICSLIIIFSIIISKFTLNSNCIENKYKKTEFLSNRKKYKNYLLIFCIILMIIYYPLYNYSIGVTGLPGQAPFHISGIVHYIRAYIVPIFLVFLISQSDIGIKNIAVVFLYSLIAGISASSRFVAILPVAFLMLYFSVIRNYLKFSISLLYSIFLWFVITASRDLTFDGGKHDFFDVIYYSLTNIPIDRIIDNLDLMTGRLSGAQQIVLVEQFHGNVECSNIIRFLLGIGSVCNDTAGLIYGLDLSGTSYGLGISMIPSIIVSGDSWLHYFLPSFFISLLILLTQYLYVKLKTISGWSGIDLLYLFLSVLFIFLGQLNFYYLLQLIIFLLISFRKIIYFIKNK